MGGKLQSSARGIFPRRGAEFPFYKDPREQFPQKYSVLDREFAKRAGLPSPEDTPFENLGNPDLPVHKKKRDIQTAIRDNQISMVEGPTGSGKSTQIAQYALEMGYPKIVYLEPRVLLADNLSDRISQELDDQLGSGSGEQLIGVRHSGRSTGKGKPVEVMTPGTFMRVMDELEVYRDEPVLVVADEIHEKDFETELAVAASVYEIRQNPKWRLLLASATLDSEPIHRAYSEINARPIPLVSVEGRPHELEWIFEPDLTAVEALKKYIDAHRKAMMFTAGKQEIRDNIDEIRKSGIQKIRTNPLHAKLSRRSIRQATHAHLTGDQRQAIVSSSAGQSGITVPELTLVISDGLARRPHLDRDGTESLVTSYAAQDEIIQQAGRGGRDVGGGVAILVKPNDPAFHYLGMEERDPQSPAQIYHTNITRNVLLATATGKDFYELHKLLINKVDQRTILDSYDVLYRLGAIDESNNITPLGKQMNRFPVRPEFSRSIVEAMHQKADRETMMQLAAILSAIEAGGLPYFERGISENWRSDIRPETNDDYIAQLDMFYATRKYFYGDSVDESELESRNYDHRNVLRAHRTFDKICHELKLDVHSATFEPPTDQQVSEIHNYLLAGLFDYAHRRVHSDGSRDKEYVGVQKNHNPTQRKLSRRGTYRGDHQLVVGMPRGFEKVTKGRRETHFVIENVMPTTAQAIGKYAMRLADSQPREPRVVGGRLVLEDDLWFGDVHLGVEASQGKLAHTAETKRQIRNAAFAKPTHTVAELVVIKKQLEALVRLTPKDKLGEFFPNGIMTDEWLNARIDDAITDKVDSIIAMDNNLRSMVSQNGIDVHTWVSPEAHEYLVSNSPEFVELSGGASYSLYYTHGIPVVNRFNLRDADMLPDGAWTLPDGREIYINYRIGNGDTKRHTAAEIKAYARSLD